MPESYIEKIRREAAKEAEAAIPEYKKHLWYNQPDALDRVRALDNTPRNANLSPLRTSFAIHAGKIVNLAFVTTIILAAPPTIAWGTGMTVACMALGFGLVIKKHLSVGIPVLKQINKAEPVPQAVVELTQNTCQRAGIDPSKIKISQLTETFNAKSKPEKILPYGAFIMPSQKHYFLGQKLMEMTDLDEIQNIIAHETGHLANRGFLGRGDTITENTITSGMFLMGVASLATLNFLGAGYYMGAAIASKIGRSYLVRLDEYRADRAAVILSDNPKKGTTALKKIFPAMLKAAYGDQWQDKLKRHNRPSWLHPHPTLEKREIYTKQLMQQMS